MGEMVYANTGKMFFKIRQKEFRNADTSRAYWTKKVLHPSMGECYENFNGGLFRAGFLCYKKLNEIMEARKIKKNS